MGFRSKTEMLGQTEIRVNYESQTEIGAMVVHQALKDSAGYSGRVWVRAVVRGPFRGPGGAEGVSLAIGRLGRAARAVRRVEVERSATMYVAVVDAARDLLADYNRRHATSLGLASLARRRPSS